MVAEEIELFDRLEHADLVITGEGFLDAESFDGKTVGGVAGLAAQLDIPVLAVVGRLLRRRRPVDRRHLAGGPGRRRPGAPRHPGPVESVVAERLSNGQSS